MLVNIFRDTTLIPQALLIFARISSFVMVMPLFGNRLVPGRIKTALSIMLTVVTLPLVAKLNIAVDVISIQMMLLLLQQVLLGILTGFVFVVIFEIVMLAGELIALQSGLGFATIINPQSKFSVPMIGQLYTFALFLVFLALNGHLQLIQLLVKSFQTVPVDQWILTSEQLLQFIKFTGILFTSGVSIALPAIVAILVVNLIFGVVTRTAPQLNIFNIGFPITLIMGLMIVWLSFDSVLSHSADIFDKGLEQMQQLLSKQG